MRKAEDSARPGQVRTLSGPGLALPRKKQQQRSINQCRTGSGRDPVRTRSCPDSFSAAKIKRKKKRGKRRIKRNSEGFEKGGWFGELIWELETDLGEEFDDGDTCLKNGREEEKIEGKRLGSRGSTTTVEIFEGLVFPSLNFSFQFFRLVIGYLRAIKFLAPLPGTEQRDSLWFMLLRRSRFQFLAEKRDAYNQPRHDPFSDSYYPGWRNHCDMSWRNDIVQRPMGPLGFQQQGPLFQYHDEVPPVLEQKSTLEDMFQQCMAKMDATIEQVALERRSTLEDMFLQYMTKMDATIAQVAQAERDNQASIQKLEVQVG
ncbi:hypothetical protein Ancab_035832 [Ancistrocladus abbreviatus]